MSLINLKINGYAIIIILMLLSDLLHTSSFATVVTLVVVTLDLHCQQPLVNIEFIQFLLEIVNRWKVYKTIEDKLVHVFLLTCD